MPDDNYVIAPGPLPSEHDYLDVIRPDAPEFKNLGLKSQEMKFVHQFVANKGEADVASVLSGYTKNHGYILLKRLPILEAIRRFVLMEFQTDAVKARAMLVEVMVDKNTPSGVKRQCAMDILNIANLVGGPVVPSAPGPGNIDLTNLTEEEKDQLEFLLSKTQGGGPVTIQG